MSSLFVTEFRQLTITSDGVPPFGRLDADTTLQTVTIGGGASEPFATTTKFVRVVADASCVISYTPPSGDATQVAYLGANLSGEYFGVDADGTLSVEAET